MGRRARPPQRTPPRFRPLNEKGPRPGISREAPWTRGPCPRPDGVWSPRSPIPPLRTPWCGRDGCASGGTSLLGWAGPAVESPPRRRARCSTSAFAGEASPTSRSAPSPQPGASKNPPGFKDLLLSVRGRDDHRDLMTLSGFRGRRVSSASGTGHRDCSAGKGAFVPAPHPPESRRRVVDLARLRLKPIAVIAKPRRARH